MSGGKGGGQTPAGDYLMSQLPANVTRATGIANQPFTPYMGQLSPAVPGQVASATTAAQGVADYKPLNVGATNARAPLATAAKAGDYQMGLGGLGSYFNPYISNVADQTMAGIDRQRQMATNQNSSSAALSGAFGGDRLGVENALTNEAYGRISADALANLYAGGFNNATGLLMGEKGAQQQGNQFNAGQAQQTALANQGAKLQTALSNQQAGLTGQLANQQAGLQGAGINLQGAQTLGQLGGLQYGMEQDPLTMQYQEFLRQQNYGPQMQAMINAALGLVGSSTSGQYVTPQYPGMDLFGGALGGFGTGLGLSMGG